MNLFQRVCAGAAGVALACLGLLMSRGLRADGPQPLERIATIELKGKPGLLDHLVVDHTHERLLVANQCNDTLDVVDLRAGKLWKQIHGQTEIHGVAYAPELDRVFTGNGQGVCNALDGGSYTLRSSQPVPDADNVRYDPATHRLYVAGERDLAVFDARSLNAVATIKLPGSPEGFQIDPGRSRLYVNTSPPNQVTIVDTEKMQVISHFPLDEGKGLETLALDERNRRLFVGFRGNPRVVVLDRESGKEVARVAIPDGIDDMFFDARRRRIYASCATGFLAVIRQVDADRYELAARVPTVKGAKTCFFDAEADRLYLAVPRQPGKEGPEVWVYAIKP